MNKPLNKRSVTVVAFRKRTSGHLRHQNSTRRVPPAYNLCPGDHLAEVQTVISPPASEGAVPPAPALRRRNWSCRLEAAGAGPGGAWIDAEQDPSVCSGAAPPLVPGILEGPGCAAARALGGTGLGGRGRPRLLGRFRWQDSDSLWEPPGVENVQEARVAVSLGVPLNCGARGKWESVLGVTSGEVSV